MPQQTIIYGKSGAELMTKDEFREYLIRWRLSLDDFAFLTGYGVRTVKGWGTSDRRPVPAVVCRLLDAWALTGGPPKPEELPDAGQTALVITPGWRMGDPSLDRLGSPRPHNNKRRR